MKTSAGSIPEGLSLYGFTYPEGDWCGDCRQHEVFLESDSEAVSLGETYGATSIIHILSGRELLTKP